MSEPGPGPWPEGCAGAVSLTVDDGRASQLRHAVPLLGEYGLPATFYLNLKGAAIGRWVILTFHDVGAEGSRLANTVPDVRELCAFLARHRQRLWTAPVATVAQRIAHWRAVSSSAA